MFKSIKTNIAIGKGVTITFYFVSTYYLAYDDEKLFLCLIDLRISGNHITIFRTFETPIP